MKYQVWVEARRPGDLQVVGSVLVHEGGDRLAAESVMEVAGHSVPISAYKQGFAFFGHPDMLITARMVFVGANGGSGGTYPGVPNEAPDTPRPPPPKASPSRIRPCPECGVVGRHSPWCSR